MTEKSFLKDTNEAKQKNPGRRKKVMDEKSWLSRLKTTESEAGK